MRIDAEPPRLERVQGRARGCAGRVHPEAVKGRGSVMSGSQQRTARSGTRPV
jgi:hypothetical protein